MSEGLMLGWPRKGRLVAPASAPKSPGPWSRAASPGGRTTTAFRARPLTFILYRRQCSLHGPSASRGKPGEAGRDPKPAPHLPAQGDRTCALAPPIALVLPTCGAGDADRDRSKVTKGSRPRCSL